MKKILGNQTKPVVIDIGCNMGEFSELVFKFNKKSTIYAYDLHSELNKLLKKKFKRLSFHYHQVALSDRKGVGSFTSSELIDRKSYLLKTGLNKIKINTLDNVLEKQKISHIAIIKIDTEGNDFKVLNGSKALLRITDVVIFEVMFRSINDGIVPQDIIEFLKVLGFKKFYRSTKFFGLVPIEKILPFEVMTQNIVASKNSL
jgi:FkbM family methyltransferase